MRGSARIAWAAAIVAVTLLIGLFVTSLFAFVGQERSGGFFALSWIAYPVVGAIIASRRPRHPVGWILVGIGMGLAVGIVASAYGEYVIAYHHPLPASTFAALIGQIFVIASIALLPFLVLLFPTGKVASARWRVIGGPELLSPDWSSSRTPFGTSSRSEAGYASTTPWRSVRSGQCSARPSLCSCRRPWYSPFSSSAMPRGDSFALEVMSDNS